MLHVITSMHRYMFFYIYIYICRTGPKTCISFLVFAVFSCTLSGLFLKAILNLFWIVEYVGSITEANATGQSTGKKRNKRVMPLEFADENWNTQLFRLVFWLLLWLLQGRWLVPRLDLCALFWVPGATVGSLGAVLGAWCHGWIFGCCVGGWCLGCCKGGAVAGRFNF